MKKIAVIVLFLSVGFGLFYFKKSFNIGSNRKTTDAVVLSWQHSPKNITVATPVDFVFTLKDIAGSPVQNAKMEIEATMNHAGMVPLYAQAEFVSGPFYKTRIKLTMAGEWILFLKIRLHSGEVVKKEVNFTSN